MEDMLKAFDGLLFENFCDRNIELLTPIIKRAFDECAKTIFHK